MEAKEFDRILEEECQRAEKVIRSCLPEEKGRQRRLTEAMNYSLTAGGKRLRPILMAKTCRMCGGAEPEILGGFMAAMEMIHTYSLVHDDLPAMDNDCYRRGKRTTWYVYGEAMGILAGDGLLNCAFETALKAVGHWMERQDISESEKLLLTDRAWRALSVLAEKAGAWGMIGGQAVDVMAASGADAEEDWAEELLFIHEHKTAALIQASMMAGAILAGADNEQIEKIEKCARNIGIAFQIQDDILDVIGDSDELGKATGGDALNHKRTYVTWKGLEGAKADVEKLSREAADILDEFQGEHEFLKELILHLIYRRK